MTTILVTGAGALLGQGILRCIRYSKNNYKVVTADPDYRAQGHSLGDQAYVIPFADDPAYMSNIERIIKTEKVGVVLIGTDIELPLFAENREQLESRFPVKIVISNADVIRIANNKWLTAEFLKDKGFPYPLSALPGDKEKINVLKEKSTYPFFAKPVDGARSKGIRTIPDEKALDEICSYPNNLVVQELLSEEQGEFTTGCMVLEGQCKAIVSLRRDLKDGNTYRAYRNGVNEHDQLIKKVAEALGVDGPVNFQYRIKNGLPVVFEINARFSGTTPLRYMFGFNEVEALLNHISGIKEVQQPTLRNGTVLRTFSDIFVENEHLEALHANGSLKDYQCEYFPFLK